MVQATLVATSPGPVQVVRGFGSATTTSSLKTLHIVRHDDCENIFAHVIGLGPLRRNDTGGMQYLDLSAMEQRASIQ